LSWKASLRGPHWRGAIYDEALLHRRAAARLENVGVAVRVALMIMKLSVTGQATSLGIRRA